MIVVTAVELPAVTLRRKAVTGVVMPSREFPVRLEPSEENHVAALLTKALEPASRLTSTEYVLPDDPTTAAPKPNGPGARSGNRVANPPVLKRPVTEAVHLPLGISSNPSSIW